MAFEAGTAPAAETEFARYKPAALTVEVFLVALAPAPSGCKPSATLYRDGQQFESATEADGTLVRIKLHGALDPASSWTVGTAWIGADGAGPKAPLLELPVVAPLLRAVAADDMVQVDWEAGPGPPYPTGVQLLLRGGGKTSAATIIGPEGTSGKPKGALVDGILYSATVAVLRGPAEGPPSEPVLVPYVRTPITSAAYDGKTLTVAWAKKDPEGTTGCRVELLKGGVQVGEFPGTGEEAASEVALDPAATYQVRLRWLAGRGSGPAGPAAPVISAAATIASATVTETAVEATVLPPAIATGVSRYVVDLYEGERLFGSSSPVAASPAPPVAKISSGLPGGDLSLRVRALGAETAPTAEGPPGPAAALVLLGPRIERATVVAGSKLDLRWELPEAPPGTIESTTIVVTTDSGDPQSFPNLPGEAATVALPAGFPEPTRSYTVRAVANCALDVSLPGPAQPLLAGAPAISSAKWDGERLQASWAWPAAATGANLATAYRLELFESGVRRGSVVVDGLTGSLVPEAPLDPAGPIEIAVSPLAPGTEFAGSRVAAPVWGAPILEQAEVLLGTDPQKSTWNVELTWTAPAGAVSGYVAVFRREGTPDHSVQLAADVTSPAKIAVPAAAADPLGGATVALRALGPATEGPLSEALPLILMWPELEEVEYDGTRVSISAAPVPGVVDGYEVRTRWDAAVMVSAGPSASFRASPPLSTEAFVEIAARRGAGRGPSQVENGVALVLGAPEIGERAFDGAQLTVAVIPSTAPSGKTSGYRVELLRGEVVVERAELPAPATGPLSLPVGRLEEPAAAHAVRVQTRSELCLGPAAEAPVTLDAPCVAAVAVGAEIKAEVLAGALPASGLTLQARLVVDGKAGDPVVVGVGGKVRFALPTSGTSWAVAARAIYDGVTGPWSEQVAVPSEAPAILAADYAEGRLLASWSGDRDATYLARVVAGSVELARAQVRGNEAELRFPAPGAESKLTVQVLAGVATGPAETLKLVTAGPAASAVTSEDQSAVTVSWQAPKGEPKPTGFVPVIAWEGETRELSAVAAGSESASVPLAGVRAGAVVGVRTQAGAALGPLGATAPVVPGRPADLSLGWEGSDLVASWTPPEGPWGEDAVVSLTVGSTATVTEVHGGRCRLPILLGTHKATLAVAGLAGAGTGAATSAPVIFAPPAISTVSWDGDALAVTWKAGGNAAAVDAYVVTVSDRGRVVAERTVAASPATLAVSGLSPEATVAVAAVTSSAEWEWPGWRSAGRAAEVAVPVATPTVSSVAVDPASGAATVSWSEVTGATYALQVYLDGALAETIPTKQASETLKTAPAAGQELAVTVRAVVTASDVPCEGPPGPRLAVLTAAPEIVAVEFDGLGVTVGWRPVDGASGYAVSVFGGTPGAVLKSAFAPAGATSLHLAVKPPPLSHYRVAVQAQRGASTGVRETASLFQPGLYVQSSASGPAIIRASSEKFEVVDPVKVYLPPLGKASLGPLPIEPAQAGTAEPPFRLAETDVQASKATLPYLLTISAGALSFDLPTRPALAATYSALLRAAEAAGAGPQGIFTLQQAISRLMPQTFAETLYYAYGLSPLRSCVDLRPGTILRVASPGFDLTAVDSVPPPAGWTTGYAPGGAIDLEIGDYLSGGSEANWLVGFDAFLATLAASGALEVPAPETTGTAPSPVDVVETGGADAADLFFAAFRNPYYRLLIPATVQAATKPTTARTSQHFSIASAPSWDQIDASPAGSEVKVAYFRGRAVLRPCIRVEIDGQERVVPVGTTVGNLLDGLGRRPPPTSQPLAGLRLDRSLGPAVLDPAAPYDAGASTRVNLDWLGLVTMAPGVDALSLPLLHGDRLALGEGG